MCQLFCLGSFTFLVVFFPALNIPEQIAEHMPGRVGKQCRERYLNHLDPSLRHGPWTEEEEALLLSLHARLKNQWAEIARQIPGGEVDGFCFLRCSAVICPEVTTLDAYCASFTGTLLLS